MKTHQPQALLDRKNGFGHEPSQGIALVITLLMLSVITFLAVAFLVLTRGHQTAVATTQDQITARDMAEAAQARAQSEVIARMIAVGDLLSFDYTASHNFASPGGFTNNLGSNDYNNVSYDNYSTGAPMNSTANGGADWAQNIANLIFDPRPPVFIQTSPTNTDFRFWIDLNRNGRFETNGYLPILDTNGQPMLARDANNNPISGVYQTNYYDGEPEWIGVLKYPEFPHSATNPFVGRYAYVVVPTGKTLDWNYIHNYSKSVVSPATFPASMPASIPGTPRDGFSRDQGVGSWELNLAGLLMGLNVNTYDGPQLLLASLYGYAPVTSTTPIPNMGAAFDDAYSFIRFRYAGDNSAASYPGSLLNLFGAYAPYYPLDGIDEYGVDVAGPVYTTNTGAWPGGYPTNMMSDIEDPFDTNKSSAAFTNRLISAGTFLDSYDRYTFQRMLAAIGTGSTPELQTYVYDDGIVLITNGQHSLPTRLRTKVNLNYDNTFQIVNGLNTSPTNLIPWGTNGLGFFTNAAESLVRSQEYPLTNFIAFNTNLAVLLYNHFGLTNIPVYSATNASIQYSQNLHRMLQLAANIYDATSPYFVTNSAYTPNVIQIPHVFRPLFFTSYTTNRGTTNLYIVGYTNVTTDAKNQLARGFKLPSDSTIISNDNVWGIPWVVGTVKGNPEFDRYSYGSSVMVARKLQFIRPIPTQKPTFTNQYFIMSISNLFGMDAWNTYPDNFRRPLQIITSNNVTLLLTNNYNYGTNIFFSSVAASNITAWPGLGLNLGNTVSTDGLLSFLQTNVISLYPQYFSEFASKPPRFQQVWYTNNQTTNGSFLAGDQEQTTYPVHSWVLNITNLAMYALIDQGTGLILDMVNLGPFGSTLSISNQLRSGQNAIEWDPTGATDLGGFPNGISNQITKSISIQPSFQDMLNPTSTSTNLETIFDAAYNPSNVIMQTETWLVNDPLVHYTVGDLTWPEKGNSVGNLDVSQTQNSVANTNAIGTANGRFEPWPGKPIFNVNQTVGANLALKDPLIEVPSYWSFPTSKFPSVGWLGRVHRGTPWQTIFLKADPNPTLNGNAWPRWAGTMDTYPTNDYELLDLFTATPNDNAARGLLSVNQTNIAPWYALFSGLTVFTGVATNAYAPSTPINPITVDPTNVPLLFEDVPVVNTTNVIPGINTMRSLEPNGIFHKMGDILKVPSLSITSPFLALPPTQFPDQVVEQIPQQVLGLLKVGLPQFVIYGYGQSLKPKNLYFGNDANFNICTNYQITGEYSTRMVCHVVGDPRALNPKIQVDSFNILPGN